MGKNKEGSVNLYYLKNQDEKNNKSVSKPKSNTKRNTVNTKKTSKVNLKEDKFNFDDEIVIGVTKIQDNKKRNEVKTKSKKKKQNNSTNSKKVQTQKKNNYKKKENKIKTFRIVKYVFILCAILLAAVYFMLSPIFDIKEINVSGNNISAEQIISLSEIKLGENIYKINKKNVINKIKENAYIENVEIKRKLPFTLEIIIKERQATYMLEYANNYAYINNQGYMLEINEKPIEKPIITGISTSSDNIKPGNRLIEEDLMKLEDVLKIMESATSNEIERLITKIDISEKYNYIIYFNTEGKKVRLGDVSDINTKMLHVKAVLEKEAGIEGEIIVDSVAKEGESRFIQKIN